jgi:hypothetical protein
MDGRRIKDSDRVGSVGVFSPQINGRRLKFERRKGAIWDMDTASKWNIFGESTSGPLAGASLEAVEHGVFYAFAWLAFQSEPSVKSPIH